MPKVRTFVKDRYQPKFKVVGPSPLGSIVDYKVFVSAKRARQYCEEMGEGFRVVRIKWRGKNVR